MLAIGTGDGQIKIFNLKGFEQEIDQAHDSPILWLLFAPNQGLLLSVDDKNLLKLWNLRDLSLVVQVKIPVEQNDYATYMYTATQLTNQPLNHRHVFVGMSCGNIYIFDLEAKQLSTFFLDFKKQFPNSKPDSVTCVKCHPDKMHRILVSYERTAAVVYSINKDRPLFQLNLDEKHMHKGKLLGLEWISDVEILLGFSKGHLEVYNVSGGMFGASAKPVRILKFEQDGIVRMSIEMFKRLEDPLIILEY